MNHFIELLKKNDLLKVIDEPCDIDLEIAHLSYLEIKKKDSKALLFLNPTDKNGAKYPPVLTNIFGSFKALNLILGSSADDIAKQIEALLKPKKPQSIKEKIDFISRLYNLKHAIPKLVKSAPCQEIIIKEPDLFNLPILKTWPLDAGQFITAGQIYSKPLNSIGALAQNLGLYRLQLHSKNELGMHWQIHKDAAHFYHEYAKAGEPMPISVAIGGDPLYFWCGQAPLPKNIFELLLYGFIRKSPAKLVKSITNDIFVPADADFIIEGFVEPNDLKIEGPFGDHTGFYTPAELFPVMKVSAITHKKSPIFHATVVGKPPLEDKFMGYATERIFLPLFKTSAAELVDYHMPENGVFHNLILAKYTDSYPAAAQQLMHAFWGVGQMSFVKHAIFVPSGDGVSDLKDYAKITEYILNHLTPESLFFSHGLADQLDHASPKSCEGAKLGIDIDKAAAPKPPEILSDIKLLELLKAVLPQILELKQHFINTANPITMIKIDKKRSIKPLLNNLSALSKHLKIAIFVDCDARLDNLYMLVWRITNNIDAARDIVILNGVIYIDATAKNADDGYQKEWPKMTDCDPNIINRLIKKGLIADDKTLFEKYEILG